MNDSLKLLPKGFVPHPFRTECHDFFWRISYLTGLGLFLMRKYFCSRSIFKQSEVNQRKTTIISRLKSFGNWIKIKRIFLIHFSVAGTLILALKIENNLAQWSQLYQGNTKSVTSSFLKILLCTTRWDPSPWGAESAPSMFLFQCMRKLFDSLSYQISFHGYLRWLQCLAQMFSSIWHNLLSLPPTPAHTSISFPPSGPEQELKECGILISQEPLT